MVIKTRRKGPAIRAELLATFEELTERFGRRPIIRELASECNLSVATVSHHLSVLKDDGHDVYTFGTSRYRRKPKLKPSIFDKPSDLNPWDSILKHMRVRIGWTLAGLASKLGEPAALLSAVEQRAKVAPLRMAFKLGEFAGCDLRDLFDEDGKAKSFSETRWATAQKGSK